MAKKKSEKPETKSDFLRKALGKNPDLDYDQLNRRWAKAGHPGEISNALYYQVRAKLGIKTVWTWVKQDAPSPVSPAGVVGEVYQLHIKLMDTQPPVWRRILVADCTLDRLHELIQTAMGWTNSHMNQFKVGETFYGDRMLLQEMAGEARFKDSTATLLSDILPATGKQFRFAYEYDFGDGWIHEVLFEGRLPAEPGKSYPLCLDGARACPPEDVGGVWGYVDFLEAIADPKNPQHAELRGWIGRKFDPEAFSPLAATRRMKKGLPDWRGMM